MMTAGAAITASGGGYGDYDDRAGRIRDDQGRYMSDDYGAGRFRRGDDDDRGWRGRGRGPP